MTTTRSVRLIQPTINQNIPQSPEYVKKRVAAYARVSTGSEEQVSSYEAQVDFYTRHIKGNAEWEFVEIYTDEGISATNTKKRDGFNRMVADALDGKIDLILTKSVSRFARNTVDTLTTVRRLKAKGVEVYFEKENIYTMDSKGELLITIMSSLAQEESRSISENIKWGQHKRMADGKVSLPYKQFLGYEKGADGLPKIVESEAEVIRLIYELFLLGKTYRYIAKYLTDQGIPTPKGKTQWRVSTVSSILRNEKYKGDALLQKKFTVDFLTKKQKVNEGEVPQYYVENSHPAIIDPETFDLVQSEIKRRQELGQQQNSDSPFSAKIICGCCGGFYGSKVWHSADKYRTNIWQCNRKYKDGMFCDTPHIRENTVRLAFIEAINQILDDKDHYIAQFSELLPLLADTSALENKLEEWLDKRDAAIERMRRCVEENARSAQDQKEYNRRYNELLAEHNEAEKQAEAIKSKVLDQTARKEKISRFLDRLKQTGDLVTEFDENLWCATVEYVTIHLDKKMIFTFRDGTEIQVNVPEK